MKLTKRQKYGRKFATTLTKTRRHRSKHNKKVRSETGETAIRVGNLLTVLIAYVKTVQNVKRNSHTVKIRKEGVNR